MYVEVQRLLNFDGHLNIAKYLWILILGEVRKHIFVCVLTLIVISYSEVPFNPAPE